MNLTGDYKCMDGEFFSEAKAFSLGLCHVELQTNGFKPPTELHVKFSVGSHKIYMDEL